MKLIVALMTCHNRREKTIASIQSYFSCDLADGYTRALVLVDDGSTDGTAEAVRAKFPDVLLVKGDGTLYWNRGMLLAWQSALAFMPDFVLWLNDDTVLYSHALKTLLEVDEKMRFELKRDGISVGSTNNERDELTYGGAVSDSRFNRLKIKKITPSVKPQPVETMNGNCVLISKHVFNRLGLLDDVFIHAMGDIDYGFRATKNKVPVWITPGFCGLCSQDERTSGTYNDVSISLRKRWKHVMSAKGLPFKSWLAITSRHAGLLWIAVYMWPYVKILTTSLMKCIQKRQI